MSVSAADYGIVLRVNERIATTYDYQRRRAERIRTIRNADSLSAERRQKMLAEVGVSTMNELFEELLVLSRADQLGITASQVEIDRAVERAKESWGIETEAQFQRALSSVDLTIADLRANMEKNILLQKAMSQEVNPRIGLEEEDLRRYYQRNSEDFKVPERLRLREVVLLESSGLVSEELELLALDIRKQRLSGRELDEVAAPYVEQEISTRAVDLGWVTLGDLDPDLEAAVWSLQAGEVSQPVAGRGGLHIIEVVEREEARLRSFAEVEDKIRQIEGGRLFQDEMQKYLKELEAQAYIVPNPPPEAAGFRAAVGSSPADLDQELAEALTAPLIAQPGAEAVPAESGTDPEVPVEQDDGSEDSDPEPEPPLTPPT